MNSGVCTDWLPGGLCAWIGSLPVKDHEEAVWLVRQYCPDIPIWVQLPHFPVEQMIPQFAHGMPGLKTQDDKILVDSSGPGFDAEMLSFFEDYMAVADGSLDIDVSRFALEESVAPGFYALERALGQKAFSPFAVKGQVTGPFTFGTSLVDQDGRAVFYDDMLRDAAVKLIAMKAKWQVRRMKAANVPVLLFLDEPALAGFGSSAFISVSAEILHTVFAEVIDAVHEEGGIAGIHVCANTEWPLLLETPVDIVSFDAYSYFDKFILYEDQVRSFLKKGGILAWGIVPTGDPEAIEKETKNSILARWEDAAARVGRLGFDRQQILSQSLITPSCGTGSLSVDQAVRVIRMTRAVSNSLRGRDAGS
ncbi:MAG: hypothetical protein GXP53_06230 [Deltaproteobacteria bacterium]|nr:hypothetical protein [Deltaproteobacteria bacterium]